MNQNSSTSADSTPGPPATAAPRKRRKALPAFFGILGLTIGLMVGCAAGSGGSVQEVPGPEVTKEVTKEVTPRSCHLALAQADVAFGGFSKVMDDIAAGDYATANRRSVELGELAVKYNQQKAACREAQR